MNAPNAPNAQSLIGRWLPGGYRVQKFIGAGAFAWVYFAVNTQGEAVAVKVLQSPSNEARTLFAREIKVLRQLPPSPYCVAYVDDGLTEEGMAFLVMEYIDGCTLKDAFKFKAMWEVEEACFLMLQLCDALGGLHRLGLAHRDLKPENVMVTRDWQVKLMDFGLVKDAQGLLKLFESEDILTGRDFAENIDKAMLAGTPEYMAPEQFSDPMQEDETLAKTDTWSDVYSLGLIFYQLMVGKKLFPFRGATGDSGAYARSLLAYIRARTGFQDGQLVRPEQVPAKLWTVIAIALRQNPKQRQHNATELGDMIRKFVNTGEADEFRDEEHTSMADMSMLMAGLGARGGGAAPASSAAPADEPGGFNDDATMMVTDNDGEMSASMRQLVSPRRSQRPPGMGAPEVTGTGLKAAPAVDVAAVQAYREQRLNQPGQPDYTMPPGRLNSQDLFPNGAPPMAYTAQTPLAVAPMQVAPAARSGRGTWTWVALGLLGIIVLAASGAAAFMMLHR